MSKYRGDREYELGRSVVDLPGHTKTDKSIKTLLPWSILNLAIFHYHLGNIAEALIVRNLLCFVDGDRQ